METTPSRSGPDADSGTNPASAWLDNPFPTIVVPLLIALLLSGFPLWIIDVSLEYVFQLRLENRDKSTFLKLDEHLLSLKPWGNPDFYLKKVLRALVLKALKQPDPVRFLQSTIPSLNRSFPDLFTFFLFDADRKLLPQPGVLQPKYVSERLLHVLYRLFFTPNARKSELREEKGIICPFLDIPEANLLDLDTGTGWFFCSNKPEKSWFFYHLGRRFPCSPRSIAAGTRR